MGINITTDDLAHVSADDRFMLWQDLVSHNVLGQDIEYQVPQGRLYGSIQTAHLKDLLLAKLFCNSSQKVSRSKRKIAEATSDTAILCMQATGTSMLITGGATVKFNAGDWTLCDCQRPYSWDFLGNHGQMVLRIPKQKLYGRLNMPEIAHGRVISSSTGAGKITWDFINSMWMELLGPESALNPRFEDFTIELISTAINEYAGLPKKLTRSNAVKLMEVKAFIQLQIQDPGLYVESIASALNISTRYLHLLFQKEETTISQYIRDLRLRKCATDLANPHFDSRSITDIAFTWGFSNHAHFSKLFKKNYGMSARDYRKAHTNS